MFQFKDKAKTSLKDQSEEIFETVQQYLAIYGHH